MSLGTYTEASLSGPAMCKGIYRAAAVFGDFLWWYIYVSLRPSAQMLNGFTL